MTKEDYAEVGRRANGQPMLRVQALSFIARLLNVQIKIGGWPYGADWSSSINGRVQANRCNLEGERRVISRGAR